jgi:hypothetical protein
MIFHLLLTAIYGYFAHFSYLLTSKLSNGWSQLSAYTLGVLFALPSVIRIHKDLADIKNPTQRLVASYLLGFLAFGVGTVIGWVLHPMDAPSVMMMDDRGIQ